MTVERTFVTPDGAVWPEGRQSVKNLNEIPSALLKISEHTKISGIEWQKEYARYDDSVQIIYSWWHCKTAIPLITFQKRVNDTILREPRFFFTFRQQIMTPIPDGDFLDFKETALQFIVDIDATRNKLDEKWNAGELINDYLSFAIEFKLNLVDLADCNPILLKQEFNPYFMVNREYKKQLDKALSVSQHATTQSEYDDYMNLPTEWVKALTE